MKDPFDIDELKPGAKIDELRPFLNALVRAVKALRPGRSSKISSKVTPNGTLYDIIGDLGGGAGATTVYPFAITDATDRTTPSTPVAKVTVRFGTVQNYVPTMDGDSLSLGHKHTFSSAGTYTGYIDHDGSAPIIAWTTSPVSADSSTHTYAIIGEVDVVADGSGYSVSAIRQNVYSSFLVRYCSGSVWFWTALEIP